MEESIICPSFIKDIIDQCHKNPAATAFVEADGRRTSYGEFYDMITRTSGYIKSKDFARGSFVVICLPNSPQYMAVDLGCWLAGCAIAPVSPLYPKARIDYISEHCESPLLVDEACMEQIMQTEPLEICETTADIAALYYTSGSTGTPKGVMHTFNTLSHIDCFGEYAPVTRDDCFGYGAPFSFIASMYTVPYLRAGACVRLFSREEMTDVHLLQKCFDDGALTCALLNPSALSRLNLKDNRSLRLMLTGTERVSCLEPESGYRLFNLYGMTETVGPVIFFEITRSYRNTPIGKCVSDCQMKLAEDGEICLRGLLTPGYYKDPERSAALWEGGWMHTGDIGRMLDDGNVEYVNRKDWMVKINGQRVETGEISQVMLQMDGVSAAIAKGFSYPDGRQYIVAYYVAEDGIDDDKVRQFISGKLAPYMIPSQFVKMSALPLNANGKVDFKSLQSPLDVAVDSSRTIVAPVTDSQKALCGAFETALGISPVGIDDDFFSLGGDSIRVMQLQLACPSVELSSTIIYKYRTVRAICEALQETQTPGASGAGASGDAGLAGALSDTDGERCPLSKTQEGIYVESMARRGEIAYNNPLLYRITGHVDAERLAAACTKALRAHPGIFATIEVDDDGNPLQIRRSAASLRPEDVLVSVETLSDAQFGALKASLVQPFDLLGGDALFRIRIFQTESAVWLFTDFHHIIYDGTSNSILFEDIERAYAGKDVEVETFTGFDLAVREKREREGGQLEESRDWYLERFTKPDRTSLPDPDRFSDRVAYSKFETPTGISALAFKQAAERLGVTANVLATGAFGHMLGACSHSKSSAFATVYNGRKSLKTARTMSMLVKTLPVYCSWEGTTGVGEYLREVKEQLAGAMAHDLFSFAELCASTAYDSRVIFTYQDDLLERGSICGASCEMISLLENATGEALTVQLYTSGGSMVIRTEYRSNMYSEEYIRKYISCFVTVLSELTVAGKDTPLTAVNLLPQAEASSVLATCKGPEIQFDRTQTYVSLFRKQVAACPDATALVAEDGSLTYAQLDRASDRLASLLLHRGVAQEDFVAVMLPRKTLFTVSYIACFKAGAAYVPMDYEYPADRIAYMLEDSGAKVLLTTRDIYEMKCSEGNLQAPEVVFVEEQDDCGGCIEGIDNSRPGGLAYMIYTSGTTGKPKGVMIEHHSLVNLVTWYAAACEIGPGSRVAEHASFSFDGSVADLMTPNCFGGELHILPAAMRKDLSAMYRYFCERKIDSVLLTTQLGMTMLRMYDLKLKYLTVGGEKLSGQFKTSVGLYNAYGPTEFTVASSYYRVDTENLPDNIPIGKAVPNTLSAVVDSCGRLLPEGIAGELVLVGEQLSRGYWHRPDITDQRFVDCPFIPGQKMYRTGDLVKWDANKDLLFLGRIDTQVKLRGFRIELGEIESNISKFEGIKSAVVAVKEIAGLQHLCAYYVADRQIDKDALKARLAESLTDYMVPTAYMQMEALPLTPNGKVDMRSLPAPEIKAEESVPPATPLEETLFDIVSDYLKINDFGVTSNLISLGLTSLGAISLSLQIERKAALSLPSPKILELPTIRQWAEYLSDNQGSADKGAADCAVKAYPVRDVYPMTDNQTGIYIDWEQHKDSVQYNVPMLFRFEGVAPQTVQKAVVDFIAAHPYLKTRLKTIDGQVMQLRQDSATIEVPVQTLDSEPDRTWFQSRLRPFDLFTEPLCRFCVYAYDKSVWLLSDIHHIVFDGGSEAILSNELVRLCGGGDVTAETFSAFDYSLLYSEWKQSEEYSLAEKYFSSLLDGTVAATLPSTADGASKGSATVTVGIDREPVRSACRSAGVTENAFFLTAVTEVLHRFSREDNIAILTVSNGRSLRDLERTCGMFVQTLPIVSHRSTRTVGESLRMMHGQIVETLSRDKFPYARIVETTQVKPGILLAYQGDVMGGPLEVGGHRVELTPLSLDTAKFPLSINVTPGEGTTRMDFEYDRAAYSQSDIEKFACAVKALMTNILNGFDAGLSLAGASCVDKAQGDEVLKVGSGPKIEVAPGTLVGLFRRQVATQSDAPAVSDSDGTLSYAQLDRYSDILAHELLAAGLRKEGFVSLMLPRRKEFVVAYLAVFKSGGAYLPMDHEYPIDRLQYMIDDSASKILVTTHEIFKLKSSEGDIKADKVIFIEDVDFSVADPVRHVDNSTPDGLAYMIYTSGTTGRPKGVMIEHRALMNMVSWNADLIKCVPGTRFAEHASFSFDASVMDLTTPIAFGGHLHIIDEVTRKDPEMMYKWLVDNRIEAMVCSTQLGMMLLSSYKLPIRYIMMGGEKLTGRYDESITVVNGYGPTEFTVCSSWHILDPHSESDNIPIGRAVANTVSAIVDPYGQLLPKGVPGELVVIGPQIARGYWGKEKITRERFVPCPFIPGERMYHTGDLARWSDDGELLFMGRIDTQVKLRGFRIELGEIESQMSAFDGVTAAVALVREIGGVQHLCAWFTAGCEIDTAQLKAHLMSRLTAYMVPDAFMQLESMPLTPNGKIDLKKLPLPQLGQTARAGAFEAPDGELETSIAEVFRKALGSQDPLDRNASFFQMGGTSLLVMKLVVTLSELGHSVTYGDIFKYPTPRTLAAFIEGFAAGTAQAAANASPAGSSSGSKEGSHAADSASADTDGIITRPTFEEEKPAYTVGEDGFDYTDINGVLQENSIGKVGDLEGLDVNPVGDVLLLGSTGYLGIHVLGNLIEKGEGKIYCLIRPRRGVTCEGRLKSYLMYYFDNTFAELFGKRIFVIEGDMTDDGAMDSLVKIKVDTVVNCAANVKHFAPGDEIEKINLGGTEKLIEYCLRTSSRLIHTSTHSISGQSEDAEPHIMAEDELYFGQKMMTKYQTSKFAAERAILQACATRGLRAKIMRLGNLMPRFSDGEFQINIENNGFMSRMRAYYALGCIASEHLHSALEFAPIDATADAILTLARTPDRFTVFHPFNNHTIYVDDVVAVMRKCGLGVKVTDSAAFNARLEACLKDDALNPLVSPLLVYSSHDRCVMNAPSLDFTVYVLNAMDWRWPVTGIRYLSDSFEKMIELSYFDK